MGMRISTNVQSLVAQRHLSENNAAQRESLERLASGSRVNKAADDAAGLAISEQMRGHIRSIRQDVRNANDGISMIQTAEGGMNEVSNILIRFRELAIQSASDTIGDDERKYIDKEVQQLKQEVNRIANSTEFNGRRLLRGEGDSLTIQVGFRNTPEYDRVEFDPSKINVGLDALGLDGISVLEKSSAQDCIDQIDNAQKSVVANRAELGAFQNRLQSTINNLSIYEENLSASKSRIKDADIAQESSELTKRNILSSAGIAVLSQANTNNAAALKLL
ncbi:flagellin FliC [bacterium]|nr:flagellin FliC [bacterium]